MYGERDDPYIAIAGLGRKLASSLQPRPFFRRSSRRSATRSRCSTSGSSWQANPPPGKVRRLPSTAPRARDVLALPLVSSEHACRRAPDRTAAGRAPPRTRPPPDRRPRTPGCRRGSRGRPVTASSGWRGSDLIELREEERRRIRRDLHDGLGPALAGLTFTLEAVRNLAESDLQRADALLVSATEQVQTMIGDVRRLIYGLRPPTLDQLGLAASLRALATRESSPETSRHDRRSELDAPAPRRGRGRRLLDRAGSAHERQAARSGTNLQRARAGGANCAASRDHDDGGGLSRESAGIGLHTMKERAAEIGGTCEISSAERAAARS